MRIHQVVPKIYHTYSKIWVNRDWVICFLGFFFGDFWGRKPDLHSEFSDFQSLSVFSLSLEPLWKSDLHWTQFSTTSETLSGIYLRAIFIFILIFMFIFMFICITKSADVKLWWIWIYLTAILPPLHFVETSRPLFTSSEVGVGVTSRKFDLAHIFSFQQTF